VREQKRIEPETAPIDTMKMFTNGTRREIKTINPNPREQGR